MSRASLPALLPLAVATAVGAGSLIPVQAADPGYSLRLTGPTSARVGQPTVLTASGTESSNYVSSYVAVYAIPRRVTTTCPGNRAGALQLSSNSSQQGGHTVSYGVEVDGTFSIPVAFNPEKAGTFLLCAYLDDLNYAYATAQHVVSAAAAGSGARKPANVVKPALRRAGGKLVCKRGTWSHSPRSFSYRWRIDGVSKRGARTLRVTRKVRGAVVRCAVTARNRAGATTALSRPLRVR